MKQANSKKRARPTSPITGVDGSDRAHEEEELPATEDDAERTLSDTSLCVEPVDLVDESSARDKGVKQIDPESRRAIYRVKAMRALGDLVSKRDALPTPTEFERRSVWTNARLRSLAVVCELQPPPGSKRVPLLALLEEFRERLMDSAPSEAHLDDAPPYVTDGDLFGDDEDEATFLRAQAKKDLQDQLDMEEREYAEELELAAKAERDGLREALVAVHDSEMEELQGRLDALRRQRAAPSPLLAESRIARLDKGLPRPVPQPTKLADPPRTVERPARVEEGSVLPVVRFLSLNIFE